MINGWDEEKLEHFADDLHSAPAASYSGEWIRTRLEDCRKQRVWKSGDIVRIKSTVHQQQDNYPGRFGIIVECLGDLCPPFDVSVRFSDKLVVLYKRDELELIPETEGPEGQF